MQGSFPSLLKMYYQYSYVAYLIYTSIFVVLCASTILYLLTVTVVNISLVRERVCSGYVYIELLQRNNGSAQCVAMHSQPFSLSDDCNANSKIDLLKFDAGQYIIAPNESVDFFLRCFPITSAPRPLRRTVIKNALLAQVHFDVFSESSLPSDVVLSRVIIVRATVNLELETELSQLTTTNGPVLVSELVISSLLDKMTSGISSVSYSQEVHIEDNS